MASVTVTLKIHAGGFKVPLIPVMVYWYWWKIGRQIDLTIGIAYERFW
jgi:hypothetical protein